MRRVKKMFGLFLPLLVVGVFVWATTAQAALLSNYAFDEGNGATAYNSVVTAPNGTVNGATYVAGKIGDYALSFDGVDDYVDTTTGGYPTVTSVVTGTTSFWIATETTAKGLEQVCRETSSSNPMFSITLNYAHEHPTPGNMRFFLRTNAGNKYIRGEFTSPSTAWLDGNWHLFTATWDTALSGDGTGTNTVQYYLDGDSKATSVVASLPASGYTFGNPWRTRLASYFGKDYLNGKLDDVSVWGDQLSATEAKALYSLGDDIVLDYGAKDAQELYDIFAMGPGGSGTTSDGTTWGYATGLSGTPGTVVNGHTALILDGSGNGVQIPEPGTLALLATGLIGLLCYAWRKRK